MKFSARACLLFLTLFMGIFFLIPQVQAAKPIAKVTSFKGQVLIQSGTDLVPVMRVGQFLYEGSRVQTKQGQVQVTFNDGAIIKVSPFSNTLIQEREEKSGFWVFKSKKTVRRITAFVGKLWFKSGASKRRNFLQTPTAVCGIRGSDGDFGFDNQKSYLKMYTGTAEVNGNVTRGRFKNPGKRAADKNPVYRRVERAYVAVAKARATKKPAEIAKAKVAALHVAKEASKVIKENNPDETVKMIDGEIAGTTADAGIAKEKVAVSVEELKENRQHLQQAMANAKDEKEVKMIEKALNDAGNAIGNAEKQFVEADRIVREVNDMAARHDMEAMRHAAEAVQKIDGDVRKMYMDMTEDTKNMFKEMGFVPPSPGMHPPPPGQYPPGVRPPGEYPPGMQPPPNWDPRMGPPPDWDPSKGPPPGWDPSKGPPPGEYGMYPPGMQPPGEHPPGMYPPGEYPPEYGMYPPGEHPPGMYPPGDYPPGEYPPGMYPPPGDYPPGDRPPGEYPPGMYPPGEYPSEYGMYPPPGDYPPGEYGMYPPGNYPPGDYPPGEYGMYPPGDYPPGDYPPGEYGMYPPGDYPPGEYGMYPPGDYPPGEYGMYPPGDYPPGEYGMYPPGDYPPGDYPPEYGMYPPPGDYIDDPYYDPANDPYYDPANDPYYDPYYDPADDTYYNPCSGAAYCDKNCDGIIDAYETTYCNATPEVVANIIAMCNSFGTGQSLNYTNLQACFNDADLNHDGFLTSDEAILAQIEEYGHLDYNDSHSLDYNEMANVLVNCDNAPADGVISQAESDACNGFYSGYIDNCW